MENIFKQLGYSVSEKRNSKNDASIAIFIINNSDGSPRWIWNAKSKTPHFLKFYNASTVKARVYVFLIKLIFALKLQQFIFKSKQLFFSKLHRVYFNCDDSWALFTGTIGPNNKAVLYVNQFFYKVATTSNAQMLIQKEHQVLENFSNIQKPFITPESKYLTEDIIQLSDIANENRRANTITDFHLIALNKMSEMDKKTTMIKNWETFQKLKADFDSINDDRIPLNLIRKIKMLTAKMDENDSVETSFSHGDFTQWNMYLLKDGLGIYDWELASSDMPKGFDFFHYTIQKGILVDRKNWKSIYTSLKEQMVNESNSLFDKQSEEEFHRYLKYYLLVCSMHYVTIYAAQPKWHMQIEWLLQMWNEGLNTFLSVEKKSRDLIIMDLFDGLHNQEYAALKFTNDYPEHLSMDSDIDMITTKKVNDNLLKLLMNHALVSKITVAQKSFMNTIQIITNQGDFLSVDLIWQIKRRNYTILNAKKIIENSFRNSFGVKMTSATDTARYIVLFYVLNGARIPKKYLVYEQAFSNSVNKLDSILQDYFVDQKRDKKTALNYIKTNKQNKKGRYIKNTILYAIDTVRSFFHNRGFIITFSGVDGAGKSTVIENISQQIEKQLRKPVVVLRHRPSILPILSVWTKGKERAHQEAVSKLPRQGNNASFVSSLLRFSYYYFDYIIGQFVIYCKYILRGYVVIYDRYYFDFINDSKRSNIVLPKWISQMGYFFLLKPQFNFFLFADAKTILSRKKELNESTIEELTKEYNLLFNKLDSNSNHTTYKAIKNDKMDVTLQNILATIKADIL